MKLTGIISAMIFGILASMSAFTGEWRIGAAPDEGRGQYAYDDRADASNGRYGLDGNRDSSGTEPGSVMTNVQTNMEGAADMIQITIQVGERQFEASFTDNDSTRALIEQMPMTIEMGEMNGNEKYFYLPLTLPADARSVGDIHTGDLMLYGSDCLVLFYKDFKTSYRYTRLGSVPNPAGLEEALGRESVEVSFRLSGQ